MLISEAPKDLLDVSKRFSSHREEMGVEDVVIGSDHHALTRFISDIYDELDAKWGDVHHGADLPVTFEELYAYSVTALRSRIDYVRKDRRPEVRTNETWYLPAPVAMLANLIGYVDLESPVVRVQPQMSENLRSEALSHDDWLRINMRMRRIESDPNAKILFAHGMESDRRGDEGFMTLALQVDTEGKPMAVRGRHAEVEPIRATAFLVLGVNPTVRLGEVLSKAEQYGFGYYFPAAAAESIARVMSRVSGNAA